MLNLSNFKILLSYSSINQSSWIILLIYIKSLIWLKYFLFYSLILLSIFTFIYLYKIFINTSYLNFYQTNFNIILVLFIFNIAGIPPFSFFYIKWYRIFLFLNNSNLLIIFIIIIFRSLILLYIYTNIIINSIFLFKFKSKIIKFNFKYNYILITIFYRRLFFSSLIFII